MPNKTCRVCNGTENVDNGKRPVCRACSTKKRRRTRQRQLQANAAAVLVKEASWRAKGKDREFTITEADISIPEFCPILGVPLNDFAGGRKLGHIPSIDRIDNAKGYVPGNILIISFRANHLKSDASSEEMMALGRWAKKMKMAIE